MRELVGFACDQCKRKELHIDKEPEENHGQTVSQKFCASCRAHTLHREVKV